MNRFPNPLLCEHLRGVSLIRLTAPFIFISRTLGKIEVPENFISDGASVPRIFWTLVENPFGECLYAAVIHDWMCVRPELWSRKQANEVFLEILAKELHIIEWKSDIMWRAVSLLEKGDIENAEPIYTINDFGGISDTDE